VRRSFILFVTLLAGAACVIGPASANEVAAVVSAKMKVVSVTQDQLSDIFLGRSNRFPDGTLAIPCDLPEGSPLRETFYSKVLGKSQAQIKAHWSKIIFTGRGQPPRQVASSGEAKRLAAENPGIVCYIEADAVDPSVRAVLVR
jgi:ABC-type phosphate transport system substrate-binding protein